MEGGKFPRDADKGKTRKVCRFPEEFLVLAIVDQAVYLIGAYRVLLTSY